MLVAGGVQFTGMEAEMRRSFLAAMRSEREQAFLARFSMDPRKPAETFFARTDQAYATALMFYAALQAAQRLLGVDKAVDAVLNNDGSWSDIESIRKVAREQQADGFPAVYGQTAIVVWSALETFLRDTVRAWLSGPAVCWIASGLVKERADLRVYEEHRAAGSVGEHLFEICERTARSDGPRGPQLDRWKWLLKQLQLSPVRVKRESMELTRELSLVRNLLAHSPDGVVDKMFWNAWPTRWPKRFPQLAVGKVLKLTTIDAARYAIAGAAFGRGVESAVRARIAKLAQEEPIPARKGGFF
jgi:hypothetical protein